MAPRFPIVLLGALLWLGGCAGSTVAPSALPPRSPEIVGLELVVRDGVRLPLTTWNTKKPRAIVVALHGMGDYANAFAMPGPEWAARGILTYAPDQRGFGRAPDRGLWAGADLLRQDLVDGVRAARRAHPDVPVYALGESMGGAVILSALVSADPPPVDGVVLVSPAVWSRADMPWYYQAALWLVAHVAPAATFTGKGLDLWPSDNIEMLRAYARDPLVVKETRADAIWGLVNLMDAARATPERLRHPPPILFLYGAKDQIIPLPALEATVRSLGSHAEPHRFPLGYHMLMRDVHGDVVRRTVADWILRIAPPTEQ